MDDAQLFNTFKTSQFCNSLLLLAPQDKATIYKGLDILNNIRKKLKKADRCRAKANFEDYVV